MQGFLNRRIGFLDIAAVVEGALDAIAPDAPRDLDGVLAADRQAREVAGRLIDRLGSA